MEGKKVAFFLGSMGRGGAERVISRLSKDYADSGWHTDICLLLFNKVDYELDPSTCIHDFTGRDCSRLKRVPYWLRAIRRFVKKERPDVIVSFAARINVLVLLACRGLGVKTVISERNDPKHDGRGMPTRIMTRLLYPNAHATVFQTKRVQSYFPPSIQRKSVVIPNPVSVSAVAKESKPGKLVTVGRLTPQKNQRMLINAFADIAAEFPEAELFIFGEGELRGTLEEQVRSLQLQDAVRFMGNVIDVHEQISDAAMFVLPSDYEGLSNALLEAMLLGLPCISTDCAGSDEYIEDGKNGLLTPVGDQRALTEAIRRFLTDQQLRIKCGKGAAETMKQISAERVLKKWHDVID